MQVIYDIESYPNFFSIGIADLDSDMVWGFEISDRYDHTAHLVNWCQWAAQAGVDMIGFNNEWYDYPVLHHMLTNHAATGVMTAAVAYEMTCKIIASKMPWENVVWENQRHIRQIDLFKIWHFDNFARSTSLKKLEINMRASNVQDLPIAPGKVLTPEEMDVTYRYMWNDIFETKRFAGYSKEQIAFRRDLVQRYPDLGDVMNWNDTKIGKKFFEFELNKRGIATKERGANGRQQSIQTTHPEGVKLSDVISPRVQFQHPGFQSILDHIKSSVIPVKPGTTEIMTKGFFKDLHTDMDGFDYHFGVGGIHGSLENAVIREDDEWEIWDWDVTSYYPNLAITNGFFPTHLGEQFCSIYKDVYDMRQSYPKKSAENAMLKLALNGVYGDSNNKHSVFYDTSYTMSITLNGQLYLCMLAESLRSAGIQMIQINTDGLTVRVHKNHIGFMRQVCEAWEKYTGLQLEDQQYQAMFIRDVNSYIGVKPDGTCKRIGAYAYVTPLDDPYTRELGWHKDHSHRVVTMAAEAAMVRGGDPDDFIRNHRDLYDFCGSVKVPRNMSLTLGGVGIQNTTRFYVSTAGEHMIKWMDPLPGKTEKRQTQIHAGWRLKDVNDISRFDWSDVNYLWYKKEAKKLIIHG